MVKYSKINLKRTFMFDIDLIFSFLVMTLLFLRQVSILKHENKLNYAPLMLGIGAIASIIHFIIHAEVTNVLLLMRGSFLPLLVSLLLYIVMNIMHQTIQTKYQRTQDEFTKTLISQITQLQEFFLVLDKRVVSSQEEDRKMRGEAQVRFDKDIATLDAIQVNQAKFLENFDDLESLHKDVRRAFVDFSEVQLPRLDDIVHKNIDTLRIVEQDHY
jgi:K+ transporter